MAPVARRGAGRSSRSVTPPVTRTDSAPGRGWRRSWRGPRPPRGRRSGGAEGSGEPGEGDAVVAGGAGDEVPGPERQEGVGGSASLNEPPCWRCSAFSSSRAATAVGGRQQGCAADVGASGRRPRGRLRGRAGAGAAAGRGRPKAGGGTGCSPRSAGGGPSCRCGWWACRVVAPKSGASGAAGVSGPGGARSWASVVPARSPVTWAARYVRPRSSVSAVTTAPLTPGWASRAPSISAGSTR